MRPRASDSPAIRWKSSTLRRVRQVADHHARFDARTSPRSAPAGWSARRSRRWCRRYRRSGWTFSDSTPITAAICPLDASTSCIAPVALPAACTPCSATDVACSDVARVSVTTRTCSRSLHGPRVRSRTAPAATGRRRAARRSRSDRAHAAAQARFAPASPRSTTNDAAVSTAASGVITRPWSGDDSTIRKSVRHSSRVTVQTA